MCLCVCMHVPFSHVQLFAIPWTIACQASLSMEFSRQEYWNGLPFSNPVYLPYYLDYCNIGQMSDSICPSHFVLQNHARYSGYFASPYKVLNELINIHKITFWDFEWKCIESRSTWEELTTWRLGAFITMNMEYLIIYLVLWLHSPELRSFFDRNLVYVLLDLYLNISFLKVANVDISFLNSNPPCLLLM